MDVVAVPIAAAGTVLRDRRRCESAFAGCETVEARLSSCLLRALEPDFSHCVQPTLAIG
jgi:hypothetical protein